MVIVKRNESGLKVRRHKVNAEAVKYQVEQEHMKQNARASYTHYKTFYEGVMGDDSIPAQAKSKHFRTARAAAVSAGMQKAIDSGVEFSQETEDPLQEDTRADVRAGKWDKQSLPAGNPNDWKNATESDPEELYTDEIGNQCKPDALSHNRCNNDSNPEDLDVGGILGNDNSPKTARKPSQKRFRDTEGNVCLQSDIDHGSCAYAGYAPNGTGGAIGEEYSALEAEIVSILEDEERKESVRNRYKKFGISAEDSFSLNSSGLKVRNRRITRESVASDDAKQGYINAFDDLHNDTTSTDNESDDPDMDSQDSIVVDDSGRVCYASEMGKNASVRGQCPRDDET